MSITDGRYKDQKKRLYNCGLKRVIYLVEGVLNTGVETGEKRVYSALSSTRTFGRFSVQKTQDEKHSLRFLTLLNRNIEERVKSRYEALSENQVFTFKCEFSEFCEKQKLYLNKTVERMFSEMIRCIPGIGAETTYQLANHFGTMRNMFEYFTHGGDIEDLEF